MSNKPKTWVTSEVRVDFEIWPWFKPELHDKHGLIKRLLQLPGVDEVKFGECGYVRFAAMNTPEVVAECVRTVEAGLAAYIANPE